MLISPKFLSAAPLPSAAILLLVLKKPIMLHMINDSRAQGRRHL